ncbi:MAG: hypothetical protein JWQ35_2691 [Bacteriovoracaceae bacterium]|nr:hypothetical protein [Bacteriovoracaceae bacterium]
MKIKTLLGTALALGILCPGISHAARMKADFKFFQSIINTETEVGAIRVSILECGQMKVKKQTALVEDEVTGEPLINSNEMAADGALKFNIGMYSLKYSVDFLELTFRSTTTESLEILRPRSDYSLKNPRKKSQKNRIFIGDFEVRGSAESGFLFRSIKKTITLKPLMEGSHD